MPITINNRTRTPFSERTCFIYNDAMALRDAHKKIKSLPRGKTLNIPMLSLDAMEELMEVYSAKKYEIEGTSINEHNQMFIVTVYRYTVFECLRDKFTAKKQKTKRSAKVCSADDFDFEW